MEMQFQGRQFMLLVFGLGGLAIIAGIVIFVVVSFVNSTGAPKKAVQKEVPTVVDESGSYQR